MLPASFFGLYLIWVDRPHSVRRPPSSNSQRLLPRRSRLEHLGFTLERPSPTSSGSPLEMGDGRVDTRYTGQNAGSGNAGCVSTTIAPSPTSSNSSFEMGDALGVALDTRRELQGGEALVIAGRGLPAATGQISPRCQGQFPCYSRYRQRRC